METKREWLSFEKNLTENEIQELAKTISEDVMVLEDLEAEKKVSLELHNAKIREVETRLSKNGIMYRTKKKAVAEEIEIQLDYETDTATYMTIDKDPDNVQVIQTTKIPPNLRQTQVFDDTEERNEAFDYFKETPLVVWPEGVDDDSLHSVRENVIKSVEFNELLKTYKDIIASGKIPTSEKANEYAKKFWDIVLVSLGATLPAKKSKKKKK